MTTPALKLDNVAKIFGGLRAIDGVSFEVAPRQIFGLIGPNGAGKTTAFNCISGVYTPEQGTISFFGKSIAGRPPSEIAALGIARTFQNIRLFGDMTVLENVMVAGHATIGFGPFAAMFRLRKQAEEQERLAARAHELLRIFELDGLAGEFSKSLPYGSQRKLEIARALMLNPKLLLLDEPAAGMNSREADSLKNQIRWLRDTFDLTIVLVEHNMQVVMNVCEQVHCVDHGQTIASGEPLHVQNHPAVRTAYLGADVDESTLRQS
jgi:branched-chain amino acid transport system ATP-binding protein